MRSLRHFGMLAGAYRALDYLDQKQRMAAAIKEGEEARRIVDSQIASKILGDGRMGTIEDLRALGMIENGPDSQTGLYMGHVGHHPVFYPGDGHLNCYGRARSGKGTTLILPNLAHCFSRSFVVNDVKDGENAFASGEHRQRKGQNIIYANPYGLHGFENTPINPNANLINVAARTGKVDTEASEISHMLIPIGKGNENAWPKHGARRLLSVRLEYLALFMPDRCTLGNLWRFVNTNDERFKTMLNEMMTCGNEGIEGRAAKIASTFQEAPKQHEAIVSDAIEALEPFEPGKTLEIATRAHGFDFSRLKTEPTTVYLIVPAEKLSVAAKWLALVINHIIEAIAVKSGPLTTTFILDEFPQLPATPAIIKALQLYAGKGIQIWGFSQGRHSLARRWENDVIKELEDQSGIFQMWGVEDTQFIKDISTWSGTQAVATRGPSHSAGVVQQASYGLNEKARPVLQSEDIRAIGNGRMLMKVSGCPQLFEIERTPWFLIEPWKHQLRDPRQIFKS